MWDGSAVFCQSTLSVYLCIWSTLLGSAVLFQFSLSLTLSLSHTHTHTNTLDRWRSYRTKCIVSKAHLKGISVFVNAVQQQLVV